MSYLPQVSQIEDVQKMGLFACLFSVFIIVMLCWFILSMFLSKLIRSDRAVSTSEQLRQVTIKVTLRKPQWQQGLTSVTRCPTEVMTVGFRMQMCTFVSTHLGG
ncbi:hypothetical protein XENOCAPTIV_015537 [Xenoophorus captivus]|uniref:ATP synthase F0 subunit 8 n=1 Tax=Xenoophorus captivus TaxID=1517983 RepID=A0ABV0R963_9TELE